MIRAHLQKRGYQLIRPTPRMVQRWWRELNTHVFNNHLLPPIEVKVARDSVAWAWCVDEGGGRCSIKFESCQMTRLRFLTVLVHEMVHAYQLQNDEPMDHGKTFLAWETLIKQRSGLPLEEEYS